MIGVRLWKPSLRLEPTGQVQYGLRSILNDYIWSTTDVGQELLDILEPRHNGSAGYQLSTKRYLSSEDMHDIYKLCTDKYNIDFQDIAYLESYFYDYVMWHWYDENRNFTPCKYYGFSAYYDIESLDYDEYEDNLDLDIFGVVSGYGKVKKYPYWFQSEYMKVVALYCRPEREGAAIYVRHPDGDMLKTTVYEFLNVLCEQWNIPMLSLEQGINMVSDMRHQYPEIDDDIAFSMPDFADIF